MTGSRRKKMSFLETVTHKFDRCQRRPNWKYLPDDIWSLIFLEYCDFDSLVNSRVLQTKYVKGCTESNIMFNAIEASNLKNVKWIHQCIKGFKWRTTNLMFAAINGDLEMMMWMKTNGCPWDSYTFRFAAENCNGTNFEVLEWLRINNCPWNHHTFLKRYIEQPAVIEWLLNHSVALNDNCHCFH